MGLLAKEINTGNNEGKALIDVTDLAEGDYYSLLVKNKVLGTKKLLVTH